MEAKSSFTLDRIMIYKWIANLAIPLLVYYLLEANSSLTSPQAAFMACTTWAIFAWVFGTLNDIAVGILLPGVYVLFCQGVKLGVVYAPWSGSIWILCVGGFILGKIINETGLGRRIALCSVRALGGSFAGALLGFTIAAIIFSPLVPSLIGRGVILLGVAISLCQALDFKPKSREATAIVLGTCMAVGSTKLTFLTASEGNVMGIEIVDKIMHAHTSWLEFAWWNFPPALVYVFISFALVLLLLRTKTSNEQIREIVAKTHGELGPMTTEQKKAMYLLLGTVLLLATDRLHGIDPALAMMIISAAAFLPGVELMDAKRLARVNFAPIFFVMGCMAIGSTGGFLKVNQWLATLVLPLFRDMGALGAALSSYATGAGVNFLLTPLAAISTLTGPLAELGMQMGIDPRIIYFSFEYGLDNLIFPYEFALYLYFFSSGYINFREMAGVMLVRMFVSAIFVACIAVPWWKFVL